MESLPSWSTLNLRTGTPVTMPWIDNVSTLLQVSLPMGAILTVPVNDKNIPGILRRE